jgi:hypothetical protein
MIDMVRQYLWSQLISALLLSLVVSQGLAQGDDALDNSYEALSEEIGALSEPLFEFAIDQLEKREAFLPFGATLDRKGELSLQMGYDGQEFASSVEVLPVLHDGLRQEGKAGASTVAVCESVMITLEGKEPTEAIKVLFEHMGGACFALYLPCHREAEKWIFGEVFVVAATPEVKAWQ